MPRKPTGNPRGRPKGTGHLAAPQRLTVWLDGTLFARLEAYAEGRHYHRGTPELAGCVRELLAKALAHPEKQPTHHVPLRAGGINEQTENAPAVGGVIIEQTEISLAPVAEPLSTTGQPSALTPMAEALPGVKQCRNRHPPYPADKRECPHCVAARQARQRQRKGSAASR